MAATPPGHRMYHDLAPWWTLLSPPGDYAGEAAYFAGLLRSAAIPVREVLELGSGGGHLASHLAPSFHLTLCDLSPAMVAISERVNPGCDHLVGDMRSLRLGRTFDGVLIHDAIAYMTEEGDLQRAIETAFVHTRPGGIAVFAPDEITETFAPMSEQGGSDGPDGRGIRYLEWTWDPDPTDTWALVEYAYLLRESDGAVRCVHETHRVGVFGRALWLRLLTAAGFIAEALREETDEDHEPRVIFVGRRPA